MGKQGPCYHCGVTSTPLWRNGPPNKPVLCNACGSRWRTKGSLENYTPLHARVELDDFEDHTFSRIKSNSLKKRDERLIKWKVSCDNTIVEGVAQDYNQSFQKNLDEYTSNRSSSGSIISNSESCAHFGGADANDFTGPSRSVAWDTLAPSRKRTVITRRKSPSVEKLTRDLYTILHEQQSSHLSGSSEDLLFENETPMVSVEIGHGSVLIRHPSSLTQEEESEASSLSDDYKVLTANMVYSHPGLPFRDEDSNGVNMFGPKIERDKYYPEWLQILWNHNSPLCYIDLIDVVNFDVFWGYLAADEQQQLLKYLPSDDKSTFPHSLRSMFASPYFMENLSSFQQLLAEGVFDASSSGVGTEDFKTLKRLALFNLSKCKWLGQYKMLKDSSWNDGTEGCQVALRGKVGLSNSLAVAKRLRDGHDQHLSDTKTTMKSPKRLLIKAGCESKKLPENNSSDFSPRSLFPLPSDGSSLFLEPLQFVNEISDQDLLLDIPSNCSFPEAELLPPSTMICDKRPGYFAC
ncbi:hypothetical protein Nepgr_024470 [Nepenthes gracilis]|uniref:GATA transcription factor n=1 Tax=Nepenthes gracilis TaxID=150966 RepID=A0AAD3T4N3_NEPGR|nr:hypothetical protein Nepgr_024470 [Nepenthes gracilis]